MVQHGRDRDAPGPELLPVLLDPLRRDIEGDVVHGSVRREDVVRPPRAESHHVARGGDAGRRPGGVGEPEEGQRVSVADVEEEVLARAIRQLDRLHEWHAEDVRVEVDRPRHVLAHERQVVDAADLELAIGA